MSALTSTNLTSFPRPPPVRRSPLSKDAKSPRAGTGGPAPGSTYTVAGKTITRDAREGQGPPYTTT